MAALKRRRYPMTLEQTEAGLKQDGTDGNIYTFS